MRAHVETWPPTVAELEAHSGVPPKRSTFFSALLLLIMQRFIAKDKPYHAPFTARPNMPRGLRRIYLGLTCDIVERFGGRRRCVTHAIQPQRVPMKMIELASTEWPSWLNICARHPFIRTHAHTHDTGFMPLDMIPCKYHLPSASPRGNAPTCVSHRIAKSPPCLHMCSH